jgi:hypothetical protein
MILFLVAAAAAAAAPARLPPGPIDFSAQDMRFELKDRRILYLATCT